MTDAILFLRENWFLVQALQACAGFALIWSLRDDDVEIILGMSMERAAWMSLAMVQAAALIWANHHDVDLWRQGVALALLGFTWSYAHGPLLSPPSQLIASPDLIERGLMYVLGKKKIGDRMGVPMWLIYRVCRYVAPCSGIAFALDAPIFHAVGVGVVVGYWPVAYWLARGERTKFVGAGIAGALVYGAF